MLDVSEKIGWGYIAHVPNRNFLYSYVPPGTLASRDHSHVWAFVLAHLQEANSVQGLMGHIYCQ